jgi:hypothetical protein
MTRCYIAAFLILLVHTNAVVAQQRPNTTSLTSAELLDRADRDGNGRISRDEVIYLRGAGDGKGAWRTLHKHFDVMDTNANGELGPNEIGNGLANPMINAERLDRVDGKRKGVVQ